MVSGHRIELEVWPRWLTEASKFDSMVLRIEAVAFTMSIVSSLRCLASSIEVREASPLP